MSSGFLERTQPAAEPMTLSFTVNGELRQLEVAPFRRLIDVLRFELSLTGSKLGCGIGRCGACTVLLDGAAVPSCLVPAYRADQARIETIEGLGEDPVVRRVGEAMVAHGALQCGYCTPGIVTALGAALRRNPDAGAEQLVEALHGNICRCTGYAGLLRAIDGLAADRAGMESTA